MTNLKTIQAAFPTMSISRREGEYRITFKLATIQAAFPDMSRIETIAKAESLAAYETDLDSVQATVKAMLVVGLIASHYLQDQNKEALVNAINTTISVYDDNATSDDNLYNYEHLAGEALKDDVETNLQQFITDNDIGIQGVNIRDIAQSAIDNMDQAFVQVMQSIPDDRFVITSAVIGELEHQIDYATLSTIVGFAVTKADVQAINGTTDCHIGSIGDDYLLAYTSCDHAYQASINIDDLVAVIATLAANK